MESPSKVPVPWASTYRTHAGDTPASRYASRSTASWDSRLGAMSPLVRPSWWTALPRITQKIASPSVSAWASGFKTTSPAPSPRTYPSALASNTLQRPSGASTPALVKAMECAGERTTLTPPASASWHSPARRLRQARCTAMREEEHAVSTAMLGPRKS